MAQQQQRTTAADSKLKTNNSKKQRPEPLELPSRHQSTSSDSTNDNYALSPAELYITQQAQMVLDSNESSLANGLTSIINNANSIKHEDKIEEWREKQINEIYRHEPYRYRYGTPSSSSHHSTFRRTNMKDDTYNRQSSRTNQKLKK